MWTSCRRICTWRCTLGVGDSDLNATEIIEKLQPKLKEEGLEVEFLDQTDGIVNIRAKRISPGVPVAFLVKAIAGTFRRYLPEVKDVCLAEYDPGEQIGTAPSETFEPVFKHKPVAAQLSLQGVPVVDLHGLDRKNAVRALENFFRVWRSKSPLLGVLGLKEDAVNRAVAKWGSVYRDEYRELVQVSEERWDIHLDESAEAHSLSRQGDEIMPGKIFLTDES